MPKLAEELVEGLGEGAEDCVGGVADLESGGMRNCTLSFISVVT